MWKATRHVQGATETIVVAAVTTMRLSTWGGSDPGCSTEHLIGAYRSFDQLQHNSSYRAECMHTSGGSLKDSRHLSFRVWLMFDMKAGPWASHIFANSSFLKFGESSLGTCTLNHNSATTMADS